MVLVGTNPQSQATSSPTDPSRTIPPNVDLLQAWKHKNVDAFYALFTSIADSVLTLIKIGNM